MGAIGTEEQVALAVDSTQQVRELRKLGPCPDEEEKIATDEIP